MFKGFHYIAASVFTGALIISTPFMTDKLNVRAATVLLYGSIVTPVFEETVFRGYIWKRLEGVFKSRIAVYAVCSVRCG